MADITSHLRHSTSLWAWTTDPSTRKLTSESAAYTKKDHKVLAHSNFTYDERESERERERERGVIYLSPYLVEEELLGDKTVPVV
jgi:hypothetical protein